MNENAVQGDSRRLGAQQRTAQLGAAVATELRPAGPVEELAEPRRVPLLGVWGVLVIDRRKLTTRSTL